MKTPSAASQNWQLAYRAATSHISTDSDARYGRTASLITPRLYLSDYFTARDEDTLARLGITHVVSVLEMEPMLPAIIPAENRLHVKLLDNTGEDILSRLDETTEFIRRALAENEHNKALVHCVQGISRSATVVCAYLLATSTPKPGMLSEEVIDWIRERRIVVCPNLGFRLQLEEYAKRFKTVPASKRLSAALGQRIRALRGRNKVDMKVEKLEEVSMVIKQSSLTGP
ncbi:phosphatases II [Schizophyllum commune Tattone D]|nr:phosphatases II [Schizophyllum commune Tattone D]